MAASDGHPFAPFAWRTLDRPLRAAERSHLTAALRSLLRFQRDLAGFPRQGPGTPAPQATPFVSIYVGGNLAGCFGSDEGGPAERVARAFLRAAHDTRFGGLPAGGRSTAVVQLSYPRRPILLDPEQAAHQIEVGRHGVAFIRDRRPPVLLLPHVARDEHLDAEALLDALARKALVPRSDLRDGALYRFETLDLVVRSGSKADASARLDRRRRGPDLRAAGYWIASLVDGQGRMTFAVDARSGRRWPVGEMHHGRVAVALQALAALGTHPRVAARARRRLGKDITDALAGRSVDGWPAEPDRVAGTLALAVRAGLRLEGRLLDWIAGHAPMKTPWHAGQVVAALGVHAPRDLFALCVKDLDHRPFAPWTVAAALAVGERSVSARAGASVAAGLRSAPPFRGGAGVTSMPEVALTALAVEVLASSPSSRARAAVARGRDFLADLQLLDERIYGAFEPARVRGAFPATAVSDLLRCDVTAHAALALVTSPSKC